VKIWACDVSVQDCVVGAQAVCIHCIALWGIDGVSGVSVRRIASIARIGSRR
jgi:hypothetical protein